ncbi:hypothetical protein BWI97_07810 [Siphonobacter sp. BAB-5405]|nr:hypothetical protein BWI97_07810 [Siphonobacter sp. BAB-5405]
MPVAFATDVNVDRLSLPGWSFPALHTGLFRLNPSGVAGLHTLGILVQVSKPVPTLGQFPTPLYEMKKALRFKPEGLFRSDLQQN